MNIALHVADWHQDLEGVQLLLASPETEIDALDDIGCTALAFAVFKNDFVIASVLIEAVADPKVEPDELLPSIVAFDGSVRKRPTTADPKITELLIKAGANCNTMYRGVNLLRCTTAMKCLLPLTRAFIQGGADLNWQCRQGYTALHSAVRPVNPKAVKLILDAGADPNLKCYQSSTPLHHLLYQILTNRNEMLSIMEVTGDLLTYGADPGSIGFKEFTPAHYAAEHGMWKVLRMLTAAGADILLKDNVGNTALHSV